MIALAVPAAGVRSRIGSDEGQVSEPNQATRIVGLVALGTAPTWIAPPRFHRYISFVDLTTDSFVRGQYILARALYDIWTRGNELADVQPALEYDDTASETRQHLLPGHLDRLLDEMILGEAGGYQYSMSFGAFFEAVLKKDSRLRDCSQRVIWVLTDFHPNRKQVLWRLLIAKAHICQALIKTSTSDTAVHPLDALAPDDYDKFDWRLSNDGASYQEAIEIPFAAARRYLTNYVRI